MRRRNFVQMAVTAGMAAGLPTLAQAAEKKKKPAIGAPGPQSTMVDDVSSFPPDVQGELFRRLHQAIQAMPVFNNHLHYGSEKGTLDWYFPKQVVGKTDVASKGIASGLIELLDLPGDRIDAAQAAEVKKRYGVFCDTHSQKDYYHRLCEITKTTHIAFITRTTQPENKTLHSDKLRLVMHLDQYLFPLDHSKIKIYHPDHQVYYNLYEADLREEQAALGLKPENFDAYLKFVRKGIERHQATPGVIGGKWGFSYFRTFDVRPVELDEARRVYEAGDASPEAYKKLQDFMAFYVLQQLAELQFPLQIHTGLGVGIFDSTNAGLILSESNPALLDHLLAHPGLKKGRVCLLHGSYPFCAPLGVMAKRSNVWIDFSWMVLLLSPALLAGYLREWIEIAGPNKVLLGVDGGGIAHFTGVWCGRRALAIALARMVREEMFSEPEALGVARAVLHDNAMAFYGLKR